MKRITKAAKKDIADYKKRYGTQSAIYFAEGRLAVKKGTLMRNRPRIRALVKKL